MKSSHESGLGDRALQLLQMMADGDTGVSAARKLRLDIKTVDSHLASARRALGVHTTTHAVAKALRMEWID